MDCPFCEINEFVLENTLAYAIFDKYPVNEGHMLIIPKRHFADFFNASSDEKIALLELIDECKLLLDKKKKPEGYNIGINCGFAAGQTVFHLHIHLIPRYKGDTEDPRGGVRGVIPDKRIY